MGLFRKKEGVVREIWDSGYMEDMHRLVIELIRKNELTGEMIEVFDSHRGVQEKEIKKGSTVRLNWLGYPFLKELSADK